MLAKGLCSEKFVILLDNQIKRLQRSYIGQIIAAGWLRQVRIGTGQHCLIATSQDRVREGKLQYRKMV